MAVTRFYIRSVENKADALSKGYATQQEALDAANALLSGNRRRGNAVVITKAVALVEITVSAPSTTDAANL